MTFPFLSEKSLVLLQATPAAPSGLDMLAQMLPMFVLFVVLMYVFIVRPQRKQEKEKQQMMESMQKNDLVVTIGGLHGRIASVKQDSVLLTVANNVQLKFNKSAIQTILRKAKGDDSDNLPDEDAGEARYIKS